MPVLNVEALIENRVNAIRKYHEDVGIKRAQLDVSGGVDSAVMLGLLAKALGPENITAVYSSIHSSEDSKERAREVSATFGVHLYEINLEDAFEHIFYTAVRQVCNHLRTDENEFDQWIEDNPTVEGSLRSTLRAPVGRIYNRLAGGGIRHGTGNECEDRWLRFYQKGGDGEVDTNPLAMLSKGEVYQLAIGLGVPDRILEAIPSPDLQGNGEAHNDEDELKQLTGVDWTYSKVLLQDMPDRGLKRGDYTYVGTIERMSRLIDYHGDYFFYHVKDATSVDEGALHMARQGPFAGFSDEEITVFITSARIVDRATKHKWNPNCPSLGTREELIEKGILTNVLPDI